MLYPLLVIAALAVIVFSIVGMATISGWMPRAMVGAAPAVTADARLTPNRDAPGEDLRTVAAFECAECGVIESIREIERGSMSSASFENYSAPTLAQQGQRF
ncbi:MAG: hypothetical protein ACXWCP_18855 [Burkholderiales bacterium]